MLIGPHVLRLSRGGAPFDSLPVLAAKTVFRISKERVNSIASLLPASLSLPPSKGHDESLKPPESQMPSPPEFFLTLTAARVCANFTNF